MPTCLVLSFGSLTMLSQGIIAILNARAVPSSVPRCATLKWTKPIPGMALSMTASTIFHITEKSEADAASKVGEYLPATFQDHGFTHCSDGRTAGRDSHLEFQGQARAMPSRDRYLAAWLVTKWLTGAAAVLLAEHQAIPPDHGL